jgi:hypothetical protein
MKRFILTLFALTLLSACTSNNWQPKAISEQQSYDLIIERVNEIEPYSNFLAIEKQR